MNDVVGVGRNGRSSPQKTQLRLLFLLFRHLPLGYHEFQQPVVIRQIIGVNSAKLLIGMIDNLLRLIAAPLGVAYIGRANPLLIWQAKCLINVDNVQ